MRTAVLLGAGPRLHLIHLPRGPDETFVLDPNLERAAARAAEERPENLPPSLLAALRGLPGDITLIVESAELAARLSASGGRPAALAPLRELRQARARLPRPDPSEERAFVQALARARLERTLASPDEVLISLAREEERLERALGREERAAEAFVVAPATALAEYAHSWKESRAALAQHHAALRTEVEAEARSLLPNLSALVGPRVAARLLSAAGSAAGLGRLRAPRLQLLGSRRRPSPEHGPRYGLLYRAERMEELPLGRRGAFARSLSALAAIAVRADTITHADLTRRLVPRRDRRLAELARRRR